MKIYRPDGTQLPENHHLDYRPQKGDFRMKVTVNSDDPRMVGKRIFIPLHTKDITTARMMRNAIITALSKAGVLARQVLMGIEDLEEGDNTDTGKSEENF